jgi:hypothetical protein
MAKSIPWYDLSVDDYVNVKFYYKDKDVVMIGKVKKIYGDNVCISSPDGSVFFVYASGLGCSSVVTKLTKCKIFKAKESEFLIDTV